MSGSGGSISPATAVSVQAGATTAFTVTPNSGYTIASVGGTCGGTLSGTTYTTSAISGNCTVVATFASQSNNPPSGTLGRLVQYQCRWVESIPQGTYTRSYVLLLREPDGITIDITDPGIIKYSNTDSTCSGTSSFYEPDSVRVVIDRMRLYSTSTYNGYTLRRYHLINLSGVLTTVETTTVTTPTGDICGVNDQKATDAQVVDQVQRWASNRQVYDGNCRYWQSLDGGQFHP